MKKNVNKILAVALAVTLLALAVVAGTLAYLIAPKQTITNTFTVGEGVTITLAETKGQTFDYLPGETNIAKDPTITVTGRECWVFVTVKVTEGMKNYITYAIDDIWTETVVAEATADGYTTITYGTTNASAADAILHVLKGDKVDFKDVKAMPAGNLTMEFTAYAIQTSEHWTTAAAAWTQLQTELA